jgi:hypothetical protein
MPSRGWATTAAGAMPSRRKSWSLRVSRQLLTIARNSRSASSRSGAWWSSPAICAFRSAVMAGDFPVSPQLRPVRPDARAHMSALDAPHERTERRDRRLVWPGIGVDCGMVAARAARHIERAGALRSHVSEHHLPGPAASQTCRRPYGIIRPSAMSSQAISLRMSVLNSTAAPRSPRRRPLRSRGRASGRGPRRGRCPKRSGEWAWRCACCRWRRERSAAAWPGELIGLAGYQGGAASCLHRLDADLPSPV